MDVELRCYGAVRDAVGAATLAREFDRGSTVGDAIEALAATASGFDPDDVAGGGLVVLRNGRPADRDDRLADGDVLALSDRAMRE